MSKDKPDFNKGLENLDERTATETRAMRMLAYDLVNTLNPEDIDGYSSLKHWLNHYSRKADSIRKGLDLRDMLTEDASKK